MNHLLNKLLHYPRAILITSFLITAISVFVIKENARIETNLDKYMPQEHPAFIYSNDAEERFDIKDGIIIAIENESGVYNNRTLEKVKRLTKELQKMKEIRKSDVTSLYTADNILGTEYGLDVKNFYKNLPMGDEELSRLRSQVRNNEMVYKRLVSANEKVTVIVARIDKDVFTTEFYNSILEKASRYEGPEKTYVAGRPIVEGTLAALMPKDMKKMVPVVLLVITLVLYFLLRSIRSTLITLAVVVISAIWTFGLMAAFHIPAYAVSMMIPVMLIAIGVADGIHLYSHLNIFTATNRGAGVKEAVSNMLEEMWKPVVITSVTTAIGFISLTGSEVYPIKYFGIFTAFGVMSAMVLSLLFLPSGILTFGFPLSEKNMESKHTQAEKFSKEVATFLVRHKTGVFAVSFLLIFASFWGMSKVWINSSFLAKFEKTSDIVTTDKYINQNFGGTSTLNVILEGEEPNTFKKPEVLKRISQIQQELEIGLSDVGDSLSLSDYEKRINVVMNRENPAFNKVPDSQSLVAQYLLLYEMSGDPANLWQTVSEDYRQANLAFQLKSDSSRTLNAAIQLLESHRPYFTSQKVSMNYAGSGYKGLVFADLILEGQIKSIAFSLLIIIGLLGVMFKDIRLGLIGSIPVAMTAIITFGIMGLFEIPLNTTTALISSIAIGIGIDYAVHFIERYRIYAKSENRTLTIQETMLHSGRAISFNAVVVILGFLVLLFSVFPPNRMLGALVSINMFISFIATLTVMFLVLDQSGIYFKKVRNKK